MITTLLPCFAWKFLPPKELTRLAPTNTLTIQLSVSPAYSSPSPNRHKTKWRRAKRRLPLTKLLIWCYTTCVRPLADAEPRRDERKETVTMILTNFRQAKPSILGARRVCKSTQQGHQRFACKIPVAAVTNVDAAAAAKLLKDLHEQRQIEGRPAGESPSSCSHTTRLKHTRQANRLPRHSGTPSLHHNLSLAFISLTHTIHRIPPPHAAPRNSPPSTPTLPISATKPHISSPQPKSYAAPLRP
jgi:hypothetical protein